MDPGPTTSVLIRARRRRFETERHREGHVKMETEVGMMSLPATECPNLLEPVAAGREAWVVSSSEPLEGTKPEDTLILASGLQDHETTKFCCLETPSLQSFVSAALGNKYSHMLETVW